jgi:hypothetical protein
LVDDPDDAVDLNPSRGKTIFVGVFVGEHHVRKKFRKVIDLP